MFAGVIVPTQAPCRIGNQPHKDGHIVQTRFSHRDRGAALREQVDIGALNQLRWKYPQLLHEVVGLIDASDHGFPIGQHDFELQKLSQAFNPVEVDARSADEKQASGAF